MCDDTPHLRGQPTAVWTVGLLDLLGAALCLFGLVAPSVSDAPTVGNAMAAVLALGLAVVVWRSPVERTVWVVHANLVLFVLGTSGLVALAATGEGGLSASFAHLFVLMHAAMFSRRRCDAPTWPW